jgi:hypothetical protein
MIHSSPTAVWPGAGDHVGDAVGDVVGGEDLGLLVEGVDHLDGDHAVPLLGVRAGDWAQEHKAGIVDQGVQPSESPGGLLDGRLGLDTVGDVCFHDQRGAARLADVGGEGFQTVAAAGYQRDAGTVPGEAAVAAPMPLLAPVTRAAVPASSDSMECCPVLWMYGVRAGGRASPLASVRSVGTVPMPAREPVRLMGSGGR